MSSYVQPYKLQPTRLLCAENSPGKNTGVDCHALLQGICEADMTCKTPHTAPGNCGCNAASSPLSLTSEKGRPGVGSTQRQSDAVKEPGLLTKVHLWILTT